MYIISHYNINKYALAISSSDIKPQNIRYTQETSGVMFGANYSHIYTSSLQLCVYNTLCQI